LHERRTSVCLELPDSGALLGRNEHFIFRLHFERVIPRINISRGANHTKLSRRMRITHNLFVNVVIGSLAPPRLRPAEKYALLSAVPVQYRRGLPFERRAISIQRKG